MSRCWDQIYHQKTDRRLEACVHSDLAYQGYFCVQLGWHEEARELLQESLALNWGLGNQIGIVFCLVALAYIYVAQGAYQKAYEMSNIV